MGSWTCDQCRNCCICRFQLLNHRADMRFIMVTNLTSWLGGYAVVARSPIIAPKNPNEPLQGHLARTGTPRWSPLLLSLSLPCMRMPTPHEQSTNGSCNT